MGQVFDHSAPSLVRWGRSPDADLVYRALITFGPRTGRELGRDLGMSRGRVNGAIDELVSIGAIASRAASAAVDASWAARPPGEVMSSLRRAGSRRVAHRAEPHHHVHAAVAAMLTEPVTLGDGLRHLPTRTLARQRMGELVRVASREHVSMHPDPAFPAESVRAGLPLDRMLLQRGVRMRVLGVLAPEKAPSVSVRHVGAERRPDYRQGAALPMKLIVVDRKVAFFPVDHRDLDKGYLEVAQVPVVSALAAVFERQWESAWDPREDAVADITLSARERALVALLAEGHTDVTAAQELGISARSVSNLLRHLMDRLGVENRFQLGLALGTLRAVPPPRRGKTA
jgi:DNA-binding CsgD family transcriptional regulator